MDVIFVPLISAAIGAVAATASSVWITRTQLIIAFDKSRLEIIQSQLQKLEKLFAEISALRIDVDGDQKWKQILPLYTDRFIIKSTLIKPYSHYLSKELSEEFVRLTNVVSDFIISIKIGQCINEMEARKTWDEMRVTENNLDNEIMKKLRDWQMEIGYLTFNKYSIKKKRIDRENSMYLEG